MAFSGQPAAWPGSTGWPGPRRPPPVAAGHLPPLSLSGRRPGFDGEQTHVTGFIRSVKSERVPLVPSRAARDWSGVNRSQADRPPLARLSTSARRQRSGVLASLRLAISYCRVLRSVHPLTRSREPVLLSLLGSCEGGDPRPDRKGQARASRGTGVSRRGGQHASNIRAFQAQLH